MIVCTGESPYPGIRSRQIKEEIKNGYRMKRPEFANDLYVMQYNLVLIYD